MATPVVPQRPARSSQTPPTAASSVPGPYIPPRPNRLRNPSTSPSRDAFARSPLNHSPFGGSIPQSTSLNDNNGSSLGLARAPSVSSLPLIGQEGDEYASLDQVTNPTGVLGAGSPNRTINVAGDLPLHAPKASTPANVAKTKISTVTRTDSAGAAAAGIGRAQNEDEEPDRSYRPPSAKPIYARPASAISNERRGSTTPYADSLRDEDSEQGIPAIGLQVPMYPNAGDVQAPSPSLTSHDPSSGVGFFNSGRPFSSGGGRRKSREAFTRPPDSYGLHGHGVGPADQFEKAWYQRHPEEAVKEEFGAHSPAAFTERGQWALSSDDLNKLVHTKGSAGFGTTPGMIGIPTEQIGYMASEEYASRMSSPRPPSAGPKSRTGSQSHIESPLHKSAFTASDLATASPTRGGLRPGSAYDNALDSEAEDDTIHVDPPASRSGKYSGSGYDPPIQDLGVHGGNTDEHGGWISERGYGVPILASDEIAKDPTAEYMLPAVDTEAEHRNDDYYGHWRSNSSSRPNSRPGSRPGSIHGAPVSLSRFASRDEHDHAGTPLEEIEEYEPLFEEDDTGATTARPLTQADRFKRPNLETRRFPSSDIWEDTPNSLQLQTTVESEQGPEEPRTMGSKSAGAVYESPEAELARQDEVTESQRRQYHANEMLKPKFKPGLQDEVNRPGLRQRFPSQDIWEDTPDSAMIHTTVGDSQPDVPAASAIDTQDVKPELPDRPIPTREIGAPDQQQPSIPARPPQRLHKVPPAEIPASADALTGVPAMTDRRVPPTLPGRPKPQVPPRPNRGSGEHLPSSLSHSTSASSDGSDSLATSPPSKPTVPPRPGQGSKIANLKAGFMNTLNSRLSKGPPVIQPKREQASDDAAEEEEKAPLSDARKGRARGPVRRKPAVAADTASTASAPWGMSKLSHVWSIHPDSGLAVGHDPTESGTVAEESVTAKEFELATSAESETGPASGMDAVEDTESAKAAETIEDVMPTETTEPTESTEAAGAQPDSVDTPSSIADEVHEIALSSQPKDEGALPGTDAAVLDKPLQHEGLIAEAEPQVQKVSE